VDVAKKIVYGSHAEEKFEILRRHGFVVSKRQVVTFILVEGAVMKARYNRKEDILILELSKASIDHAEEAGPIIAHFSADDKLVLLEILEASDFLAHLTKATMKAEGRGSVEL